MAPARLPPGPRGNFLFGSFLEFRKDMPGFYRRCARDYGDVVRIRFGPMPVYQLNHPDYVEYVLLTGHRNFRKGFGHRLLRPVLGDGLILSEGDFWLRQRRLAQPAFLKSRINGYGPVMVDAAERLLGQWRDGDTRDVHADMMRLSLEIATRTLFGTDMTGTADAAGEAFAVIQEVMTTSLAVLLLPSWFPAPANLRLRRAVRRLDAVIYDLIRARRADGTDHGDLLSMLLSARDEGGEGGMTDRQVRDELMTFFLPGHETTALVLSWAWYLLAEHPAAEAELFAELQTVLAGRPPTVADLPRLRFTEMVVQESMRLYPPVFGIGREVLHECEVGGYVLPVGATVAVLQCVLHRDPRYFDRPDEFDPRRWEGDLAGRLPRFAYFPFGGGPRVCIGNTFAMMEAVLVLAALAQHFQCALVPGHEVKPWPAITLRPLHGIRVQLRSRKRTDA